MQIINKKYSTKGKIKTYLFGVKIKTSKFEYNNKFTPKLDNSDLSLSIIIPVFNALSDLKRLVNSITTSMFSPNTQIIFIDDCSTDSNIYKYLKNICNNNKYTLLQNTTNLGFIKTCNRGIKTSRGDIVVLLNSDTIIPTNFEEKILQCFKSDKNIALASPVGSNTGWFNIPCNVKNFEKIAQIISHSYPDNYPAFTPEGFCFCCRKKILNKIGLLDEVYGKGYCEEDDLVMRAIIAGYRTVLINNLFVYHKRHASFSKEGKQKLFSHNVTIFTKRYGNLQGIIRNKMNVKEVTNDISNEINCKLQLQQ